MLSIIIPVYNVELYLKECLDSVVRQSLIDKEVILVNDGSTDSSALICQEYASKYSFIRYISQENQGLSAARNTGLRYARGSYITFIDSDDIYLSNSALEIALNKLEQYSVDQVVFGVRTFYTSEELLKLVQNDSVVEVLNSKEAVRRIFTNQISISVWNKIFKREQFEEIQFPIDMTAEDQIVSYATIQKSRSILVMNEQFYGYRRRNNSITTTLSKRSLDVLKIKKEIFDDAISHYPEFEKYYLRYFSISIIALKERLSGSAGVEPHLTSIINTEFEKIVVPTLLDTQVTIKQKLKLVLVKLGCFSNIRSLFRKIV
ncbi:glycosyltransferase family 2 protein [Streptococcus suis]|nr:glycosyltransferase family 2 protein [Streptococcus suis]